MACSLIVAACLTGTAVGDDGESRSKFRQRTDAPATLVVPVQAKDPVPPVKAPVGDPPPAIPKPATQDPYEAYIRLDTPGREKLFGQRDTERELEERMRQERRDSGPQGDPIQFPEKPKLTDEAFQARKFPPMVELAEPHAIVYRRLYFEEKNSERDGWDLGPIQPLVSSVVFLKDVACLPHNIVTQPHRRFETNAGQCMPGDPVPYTIYPPELTGSGLLAEVGAVALLFAAVP